MLATPYVSVGYRNPDLHLVLDTADSCVALLLAYLLEGRYTRLRRLQDALLAQGLLLLGLAGVVTVVAGQGHQPEFGSWLPLVMRLVGGLLILVAALAGSRPMPARWRHLVRLLPWGVVAVSAVALWVGRAGLPAAVEQRGQDSGSPLLSGHPALLVAHAASATAFFGAATLFTLAASRLHDELLRWLGAAFVLAAFARVNYLLFPSMYSDWIYTGDLLRTASYAVLLVGAAREIGRYWTAQARTAVLEDRRRLARELHDGVVQELGYIRAEASGLDGPVAQRVADACDRGLDEARSAVEALGSPGDEPLGYVLHRAARQVAERYGATVVVEVDDSVDADQNQRHALVRIAREAVSNAVRHGRAECTHIRLVADEDGRRLVVADDGTGFQTAGNGGSRTGYGLVSMRERALALPGSFNLESAPGEGTRVVVTW